MLYLYIFSPKKLYFTVLFYLIPDEVYQPNRGIVVARMFNCTTRAKAIWRNPFGETIEMA